MSVCFWNEHWRLDWIKSQTLYFKLRLGRFSHFFFLSLNRPIYELKLSLILQRLAVQTYSIHVYFEVSPTMFSGMNSLVTVFTIVAWPEQNFINAIFCFYNLQAIGNFACSCYLFFSLYYSSFGIKNPVRFRSFLFNYLMILIKMLPFFPNCCYLQFIVIRKWHFSPHC